MNNIVGSSGYLKWQTPKDTLHLYNTDKYKSISGIRCDQINLNRSMKTDNAR